MHVLKPPSCSHAGPQSVRSAKIVVTMRFSRLRRFELKAVTGEERGGSLTGMTKLKTPSPFWCLNNVNLFERLAPNQMDALHRRVKTIRYQRGETIFLPGDPSDFVYFLHHGRVKLSYLDESGKRFMLTICKQGELFGEMAMLGERQRRLIAEALENVEVCIIASRDLTDFMAEHSDLALRISKTIGARVATLENRLEDMVFNSVPTRLARLLVRLGDEYGVPMEQGVWLDIRLTHRDLADLIGSTRETTTLTINQLAAQGLVGKLQGRLLLHDVNQLRHLAKLD